jgi:hypothetical protein
MTAWRTFAEEVPQLAASVRERFDAHKHKTMATLRADGSPRISGTEITIVGGELWIAGMPGSVKLADLRRDPRVAIHSASEDPEVWTGDAKVAGRAVEVTDEQDKQAFSEAVGGTPGGGYDLFRLDLDEAVVVRLARSRDHLVIESWHPDRGHRRIERR